MTIVEIQKQTDTNIQNEDSGSRLVDSGFIDILGRNKYIEQLKSIISNLDISQKGCCFAINGKWGCGKSVVVDMLIDEYRTSDDYFIIKYNAWENDFYDEPLVAMVTAIKYRIEESQKTKTLLKDISTTILKTLGEIIDIFSDRIIGIKPVNTTKKIIQEVEHDSFKYDSFIDFKIEIEKLKNVLKTINKKTKIIFVIDELDRCLPEYAIKVFERLHHIFNNESNILQIISVDKEQLNNTVNNIFGDKSADKYLEKFINFQLDLPIGEITDKFKIRFDAFLSNYVETDPFKGNDYLKIVTACLEQMSIRERIRTIEKIELIHKLSVGEKADFSVLCFEVIHYVCKYIYRLDINTDGLLNKESKPFGFFKENSTVNDIEKKVMNNISSLFESIEGKIERDDDENKHLTLDIDTNKQTNLINTIYLYFTNSAFYIDQKRKYYNVWKRNNELLNSYLNKDEKLCEKFMNVCKLIG